MAINTRGIKTAPNAFEYSETINMGGEATKESDALLATTNSTGMTYTLDRTGDVVYKMQMTCSTTEEVNNGEAVWHDWNIAGIDSEGYLDLDSYEGWIPIPSAIRVLVKSATSAGTLYWAVRGQ